MNLEANWNDFFMSSSRVGKIILLACGLLAVCSSTQGQNCPDPADTTPPVVTCSNVTLSPQFPNIFFGLLRGSGYTYDDANGDSSGVSYSLATGFNGHRYLSGGTVVTLIAQDLCNNEATCEFIVTNPLTELPMNCPDLSSNVSLSPGQATYTYTPTFGPDDVTLTTGVNYMYIGNGPRVDVNVGEGNEAPVGMNQITTVIADDALNKTCTSTLNVEDKEAPTITCPTDVTLSQSNLVYPEVVISDNADQSPMATYDPAASSLSLGTTTVTVTVTDSSSNSASCEFNVTVRERRNDEASPQGHETLVIKIVIPVVVVTICIILVIVIVTCTLLRRRQRGHKDSVKTEKSPDRLECDVIREAP